MRKATLEFTGIALYSQSRCHSPENPKLNKESPADYEARTWREKAHYDDDGRMVIPALAFKNAIAEAAKYLSIQIPGKGKSTYTKHFEAGIIVADDALLTIGGEVITRETVLGDTLHVPSDGKRGGGSRVFRTFPTVKSGWKATVEFIVVDDVITRDVFQQHISQAGQLIGIGSFRVRNNGTRGRFVSTISEWIDDYQFTI